MISSYNAQPRHNILWYIWMTLLMFLYIYEFNLGAFGLPTFLTSRRVVVVILIAFSIIYKWRKKIKVKALIPKSVKKYILFLLFILIYGILLALGFGFGTGEHIIFSIIRLLIFGFIPIICLSLLLDNVEDLMRLLLYATILQSAIIIICLIIPEIGLFIDFYFFDEEEALYIEQHRGHYAGGLACITAPGCLRFSMGLIASLYFTLKKKSIIYMIIFFYLGFVATMIARSGLVLSFMGIAIMMQYAIKYNNKLAFRIVSYFTVTAIALVFFLIQVDITEYFSFSRLLDVFFGNGGSEFVEGYFNGDTTSIPLLIDNFIIGTGIISGKTLDGFYVRVDGGYLSVYSALGFIMTIFFYSFLFYVLFCLMMSCKQNVVKSILLYFILIITFAEFKEITILKQYMLCIYCTIAILEQKQKILPRYV